MTRSKRMRVIGALVLACGIAGAIVFYSLETRDAVVTIDDGAAGYERAREHQMGQMMGTLGVVTTKVMEAVDTPGAEALIIAASAALVAALCFRVAKLMDLPPTHPAHWPDGR